jgi:alpha-glucoside transport system permease protein
MAAGTKGQKNRSNLIVNGVLILICGIWLLPALGVFITSFRDSQDIFNSGWWAVFPHKEDIDIGEIILDDAVDVNGKILVEGITATFEELREGVTLPDGRKLTWFGNKRTRKIIVSEQQWVGFANNLTLENYKDVITGKEITFTDAAGNEIMRRGNNLGGAFLNSIAVTVPATIIPILIAAFAAFGFSWLKFPGRDLFFTMIIAILDKTTLSYNLMVHSLVSG